jgi:hypothetical protein
MNSTKMSICSLENTMVERKGKYTGNYHKRSRTSKNKLLRKKMAELKCGLNSHKLRMWLLTGK